MSLNITIKQLREKAGASQQDLAAAIGINRATYAGLESGRRQLNVDEIRGIADFYQIAPSQLLDGTLESDEESVEPYIFSKNDPDTIPRDLDPEVNPEKLREVLMYVLEKVGAKPNVGETVLYKLLYFIDFDFYEKTGQSVTGLNYVRNHFGPTPTIDFKQIVEGMELNGDIEVVETKYFTNKQKKYLPRKSITLDSLRASELQHINETLVRLSDKTATELSDLSHHDMPWIVAKQGEKISYRDVFYRSDMTAVTEPEDEL